MKDNISLKHLIILVISLCVFPVATAQQSTIAERVFEQYEQFKEPRLEKRRFKHEDILPLVQRLGEQDEVTLKQVGTSIEGRELFALSIGSGDIDVLLWSQMHGDESTATMAIFDLFNFFLSDTFAAEKQQLLQQVRLHFIPMLNPDGAEVFQRRNALGVDVNRDALRLQTPEGGTLKSVRDSLDADWGFNLHDQSRYYNTKGSANPATISFLAPAFDPEKSIDNKRGDAMKLIVQMNELLQDKIPGQVGRYDDTFEPRAFGDNIQKWGTRTILIESGGQYNDREKQEIRRINFLAILSALYSIADGSYKEHELASYEEIPHNDRKLFDLKITGVNQQLNGETFKIDLGINSSEVAVDDRVYLVGRISDVGDLSTNYGYQSKDLSGLTIVPGAVYPKVLQDEKALEGLDIRQLHQHGYAYVRLQEVPKDKRFIPYPLQVVGADTQINPAVHQGANASFFLAQEGEIVYAVINGFLLDVTQDYANKDLNGLILR